MEQRTLRNCAFVKMVLMLVVLVGHSIAFWSERWFTLNPAEDSKGLCVLYEYLQTFHIYTFTAVSGYLFSYKANKGEYDRYRSFCINKFRRLIIPYIFTALVWVMPISVYFFDLSWNEVFIKYVLCVNPSQLWFLWMLFWVFIFIWPIRHLMMDSPMIGGIIVIISYIAGTAGKLVFRNYFCVFTALQYIPYFFLGMLIRVNEEKGKKWVADFPWYIWFVVSLILFSTSRSIDHLNETEWRIVGIVVRIMLHISGTFMAWTLLHMIARKVFWTKSRIVQMLCSCTMPIYLFHQQIIYFCLDILNGKINPWFHSLVNFSVALILSLGLSVFLKHFRFTRLLIGESVGYN